jgi:myo-inositol-1(or 4)-monophosphatase
LAAAEADLDLLADAARAAGRLAMTYFNDPGAMKVWDKGGGHTRGMANPVSDADFASDRLLKDRLQTARPDYGWLSEETKDDRSRLLARRSFVVDPIDGTRAFVKGRQEFAISAAVIEEGRPVAGVIYDPARDLLYAARLGGGAHRNARRLKVTAKDAIAGARLLGDAGRLTDLRALGAEAISVNSAALRLALAAAGDYDAVVAVRPKQDWDLAAGHLIMEEAGGVVTGWRGERLVYDAQSAAKPPPLAAGPALHALLLERGLARE